MNNPQKSLSNKSGQPQRSLKIAYVRLKSLMFAYFEKKYFFTALWSAGALIQPVVVKSALLFRAVFGFSEGNL